MALENETTTTTNPPRAGKDVDLVEQNKNAAAADVNATNRKKGKSTKSENNVKQVNGKVDNLADSNANFVESEKSEVKDTNAAMKDGGEADAAKNGNVEKEAAGGNEGEEQQLDGENVDLEAFHDSGITVHIQSPGSEVLSVQLSSMELVQEIHQLLMDREDTCHRTCFSLQLDGVTLDNFTELKSIEGLKHDSTIKVVEEPYTMREARIHVRHVRDLLKSMDTADSYNGVECNSLSFLHTITQGDLLEKKKLRPDSVDCTPPEYIMPSFKEPPLLPLQPGVKSARNTQALKVLTTSAWNPPPGYRKLHGDLMYLYVVTMEDKRFHISACPKGFYINQSTDDNFNPKPENPSHLSHSLIDLLSQISPTFKRVFQQMQKKRTLRHAFERVATPYQLYHGRRHS